MHSNCVNATCLPQMTAIDVIYEKTLPQQGYRKSVLCMLLNCLRFRHKDASIHIKYIKQKCLSVRHWWCQVMISCVSRVDVAYDITIWAVPGHPANHNIFLWFFSYFLFMFQEMSDRAIWWTFPADCHMAAISGIFTRLYYITLIIITENIVPVA